MEEEKLIVRQKDSSESFDLARVKKIFREFSHDIGNYHHELSQSRLGKVLTVVDGAIADETQRKAIKDLIHDGWYSAQSKSPAFFNGAPQVSDIAEAFGFKLWEEGTLTEPSTTRVNRYIDIK